MAHFLCQALDSVVSQTNLDLDIIIINDGSKDESGSIADKYCADDARIKVFHRENQGYGASVNFGIEQSIGEYIAIFEPDDYLHPQCYEKLLQQLEKDQVDFTRCRFFNICSDGCLTKETKSFKRNYAQLDHLTIDTHTKYLHFRISVWSCLVKKSLLIDNNIKLHSSKGASFQDISYYYMLICSAKSFSLVDEPLYYYRQHQQQSIKSVDKHHCIHGEYAYAKTFAEGIKDARARKRAINILNAMFIEKLIKHGKYCLDTNYESHFNKIEKIFYDMEMNDELIHLLESKHASLAILHDFKNHPHRSYQEFISTRTRNRFFPWLYITKKEYFYRKYLIA